jgi:propionyl-CoA carboxylase alpha chain
MIPISITAVIHTLLSQRAHSISGQTRRFELNERDTWAVIANKERFDISVDEQDDGWLVLHKDKRYSVNLDWRFGKPVVHATVNKQPVNIQLDRHRAGFKAFHRGTEIDLLVIAPEVADLTHHMIEKVPPDLSKFLLSPMPGLLVSMDLKVGDEIKAGEELAVVEAMKMENSLRADEDVVIAKVLAEQGDSLTVDQPILEFE